MKWSNVCVIIVAHKAGKIANQIYVLLKPFKVKERFICRVLELHRETGDFVGRPQSARINRNPARG